MAKIRTDRAEAAQYNGREAKFLRPVTDGPAYNRLVDQVIVEIDGVELYFFANEVVLTEDEIKAGEKKKSVALKTAHDQIARSATELKNKETELAKSSEPPKPEPKPADGEAKQ